MSNVYISEISSYKDAISKIFDKMNLSDTFKKENKIIIKPNLIENSAPPITTNVKLVDAILGYIFKSHKEPVIIAEGSGTATTWEAFIGQKYKNLEEEYHLKLIDVNRESTILKSSNNAESLKEFWYPSFLENGYLINVPVLKRHSLSDVTLGMKNLFGLASGKHYKGPGWLKSQLHSNIHENIFDINSYITTNLCVIDASIGMAEAHLWGSHCDPPVNKIIVSDNVFAADMVACEFLNIDWKQVKHIAMAENKFGISKNLKVVTL